MKPLKGSPLNRTSQRDELSDAQILSSPGGGSTQRRTLISKNNQKMNQTLMSYHNRKNSGFNQLPKVTPLENSSKGLSGYGSRQQQRDPVHQGQTMGP